MSKPFDITKHKWSDHEIEVMSDENFISILNRDGWSEISRDDAIAIAKHFSLLPNLEKGTIIIHTGETLKVTDSEGLSVNVNWQEDP